MKVGDLVTLSAYGKKIKRTQWVLPGDIGVVKKVKHTHWSMYEIMWNKSTYTKLWYHDKSFDRRDLKFVK
jgi:hypothetical protein